jgi:hypothetical protein
MAANEPLDPHSPSRHHLLNAIEFSDRTALMGGASFNTSTNKFINVYKDPVYVVGGEPDVEGKRIPTVPVSRVRIADAAEHIERVRQETGNRPEAIAGSWTVPGDRVDLDASGSFDDKDLALQVAHERGEEAVWDNKAGDDILTEIGKAKRAKEFDAGRESTS